MVAGRPRLGSFLIEQQIISEEQLEAANQHQIAHGCRLGRALIDLGFCNDTDIARALADQLEIPFVDLNEQPPAADCVALLPHELAVEYGVLPLRRHGGRLMVAALDPYDIRIDEVLWQATGLRPLLAMAPESQLRHWLLQYDSETVLEEARPSGSDELDEASAEDQVPVGVDRLTAVGEQPSVTRIFNSLVADAVRRGASDLHLEPGEAGIRVRCRIDGRMFQIATLPANLLQSLVARVKILAGMDIAESRRPQDGGCTLKVDGQTLELRVSTIRGVQGEIVVVRLLYKDAGAYNLEVLGFQPDSLQRLHRLLAARHGMLLTTGPTGSGKTTTLYAALNHLNREELNIITIEDPVESKLPGINHIQVHDRAGRSFATSLRAVLRQDPDVIMLGEIRDAETAEIACRAALTGHLVLSSLHTQHTLGAVARLLDIGLEPWLVASCLNGVLAQRLVRRNCDQCAEEYPLPPALQKAFETQYGSLEGTRFKKGRGCAACNGSGTRGRVAVYELLVLDDAMREFIIGGPQLDQLKQHVLRQGFRTLEDDAFQKARLGLMDPEEILHLGFALSMEPADLGPAPASFSAAPLVRSTPWSRRQPAASAAPLPTAEKRAVEPPVVTAAPPSPPAAVVTTAPALSAVPAEPAAISPAAAETEQKPEAVQLPADSSGAELSPPLALVSEIEPPQAAVPVETRAEDTDAPAPIETKIEALGSEPLTEATAPEQLPFSEPAAVTAPDPAAIGPDPAARPSGGLKAGDPLSTAQPEAAPKQLPRSGPAATNERRDRQPPVKKPEPVPVTLLPYQVASLSRSQRMVRCGAGAAILLLFGGIAVRSLWVQPRVQAALAHPQSHAATLQTPGSEVWFCPGDHYYHRSNCKWFHKRMRPVSRSLAVSQGQRPCPDCKP